MTHRNEDEQASVGETVGVPAVLGGAGALAGIANPLAGVAAAIASPLASKALTALFHRRQKKAEMALELAARQARLAVEQMLDRLGSTDAGGSLLVKVLRSAQEAGSEQELLALAACLGRAATANSEAELATETVLIDALGELGEAHLQLLERFLWTPEQLGLGSGPEFQQPVEVLNKLQIEMAVEDLKRVLPAMLQRLLASGLIDVDFPGAGGYGGGGTAPALYRLTDLGKTLLERLAEISRLLADDES